MLVPMSATVATTPGSTGAATARTAPASAGATAARAPGSTGAATRTSARASAAPAAVMMVEGIRLAGPGKQSQRHHAASSQVGKQRPNHARTPREFSEQVRVEYFVIGQTHRP